MARYRIVESVERNRIHQIHSYEDLGIHHPTANALGLKTGRPEDFQRNRPHQRVDGEFEEVRYTRDGRLLVKKDFVLSHDGVGRVEIPSPAEGFVHYHRDKWATVGIYDRPFGDPHARLLAQVLHMDARTFALKEGAPIAYGQALGAMGDSGTPGQVHAHVEAEPHRFRQYIRDINDGVITPGQPPGAVYAQHAASGAMAQGSRGPAVESLQRTLQQLGYAGRNGAPLRVDGDFGAQTEHAVRAFQRDHHLHVDGKAGARQTLPALEAASRQLLSHPSHPRHGLYAQALAQVHVEETRRHVAHGPHGERLAGALCVAALQAGLTRIDRVELNTHGTLARAVQVGVRDEVALNRSTPAIETHQALGQALLASSREARDVLPRIPDPAHTQARRHAVP